MVLKETVDDAKEECEAWKTGEENWVNGVLKIVQRFVFPLYSPYLQNGHCDIFGLKVLPKSWRSTKVSNNLRVRRNTSR